MYLDGHIPRWYLVALLGTHDAAGYTKDIAHINCVWTPSADFEDVGIRWQNSLI